MNRKNMCSYWMYKQKHSDGISFAQISKGWGAKTRVDRSTLFIPVAHILDQHIWNTYQVKTYISERHFTPDCYPVSCCYYAKFNIQRKDKKLNPGAVPTIQKHLFSQQLNRWKCFNCNLCDCGFISDIIWHINNSSIYSSTCHTPARFQHCQGWLW